MERPTEDRAAFLARACAGEEETRRRVEAMLAADAQDDLLMDRPWREAVDGLAPSNSIPDDTRSYSGEMIGDYRLIKELGRGGMGTVYLAHDTRLGRRAALKLLPPHLVNNPERLSRFQREARSVSALNHPNIITIFDFGRENERHYIVSEFVEGHTLRNLVGSTDVSLNQILDLAIQVASALEAAHAAGVIHRDIKPENIMLRPDGYAKVLDFGLAKLTEPESGDDEAETNVSAASPDFETRTGMVLGTVNYMSPEQARGQKVDGRSDLFSLGVVLYELITGRRPFGGETWHHTIVAITDSEPPPISRDAQGAPAALQEIIDRALSKNREQRYQNARALLADLETLQGELAANTRIQRVGTGRAQNATATDELITRMAINDESARDKVGPAVLPPGRLERRRLIASVAIIIL
ncbi:MAG TPA: serine/threonine-protein kinase, partial [Blastocatellia bacterium]|nr:serine/threonine-protein kinase [Blastocatellia bacterium]